MKSTGSCVIGAAEAQTAAIQVADGLFVLSDGQKINEIGDQTEITILAQFDPHDIDQNGEVNILDALTALKAMLNGKANFTLVDILRILKASAQ